MNCEQANTTIALTDVMGKLGYKVQKTERGNTEWKYLSPFRKEAEPSFYINTRENCWYDHGEAEGSNSVVDFGIKYLQSIGRPSSISDTLNWLKSLGFGGQTTKHLFHLESQDNTPKTKDEVPRDLEFIRAKPISHPAIFQYLNARGISETIVKTHLKEIQYRNLKKDKVYFGFGMKNRAGGYEVRSASDTPVFKSALIQRDITIIKGAGQGDAINIFEGMTDFLSLLSFLNTVQLKGDALIMHSLSSATPTIEFININNYQTANLWLDNDNSGQKMISRLTQELDTEVLNQSMRYEDFSDLNDALKAHNDRTDAFEFNI